MKCNGCMLSHFSIVQLAWTLLDKVHLSHIFLLSNPLDQGACLPFTFCTHASLHLPALQLLTLRTHTLHLPLLHLHCACRYSTLQFPTFSLPAFIHLNIYIVQALSLSR